MINIDGFEVHPWTIVGVDAAGIEIVEQCPEDSDEIDGYGLYAHLVPYLVDGKEVGGLTWLMDYRNKDEAEKTTNLLMWLRVKQLPHMKESNEETK